jgi:hypothetical protein
MHDALFDMDEARRLIKDGAKAFFRELREKQPEQVFYAYAIYNDGDASGLNLAANSEQGYEKVLAKYRGDESFMKCLKDMGLEFSPYNYRWGFPEWVYCGGAKHLQPADDLLEAVDRDDDEDPKTYDEFKGQAFAAMVLALRDFDSEGFFGTGPERQKVTLLCSLSDSSDTAWLEHESAHFLNPPDVYESFYRQWITNSVMEEDLAKHRDEPNLVYEAFASALASGT